MHEFLKKKEKLEKIKNSVGSNPKFGKLDILLLGIYFLFHLIYPSWNPPRNKN